MTARPVTVALISAVATLGAGLGGAWITARRPLTTSGHATLAADTAVRGRQSDGRATRAGDARLPLLVPGPAPLLAQLRHFAPLQRPRVAEALFVGRWVRWTGRVAHIAEAGSGITVVLRGRDRTPALLEYPGCRRAEIESLREGDRLHVSARVRAVLDTAVALDSVTVELDLVERSR